MLQPYARLLRRYSQIQPELLDRLDALDPDERVPIAPMLDLLRATVELTGDEDLGLKAAREIVQGEYGAVEFLVSSASSMRDSIELLGRYLPLINSAMRFELLVEGGLAIVQLRSSIALPRAAVDFQSAAFYVATLQRGHAIDPGYEAWFRHAKPRDTREYQRTFAPGKLRFGAAFDGFVFDAGLLERPLAVADPNLHHVMRKYAALLIAELPTHESMSERVREQIRTNLPRRDTSIGLVARTLAMSRRTLARRLEQEGTTFSELLENTRRELALRYVKRADLKLTEIALLLGFSQPGPFHRAFKRGTGHSPRDYRRTARY
jgi:AraC-like DNA-binding protein